MALGNVSTQAGEIEYKGRKAYALAAFKTEPEAQGYIALARSRRMFVEVGPVADWCPYVVYLWSAEEG